MNPFTLTFALLVLAIGNGLALDAVGLTSILPEAVFVPVVFVMTVAEFAFVRLTWGGGHL